MKKITKKITFTILMLLSILKVDHLLAQAEVSNTSSVLINFSSSTPTSVGSNPSSAFAGSGFQLNPSTSGRLNSNAWSVTGWSNGNLAFAGTQITTNTDYTRGSTAIAVTAGGMYAYTGSPGSASNPALVVQPGTSDFAPGTLSLKIVNSGTVSLNSFTISYNLFVRNDQARASTFDFSYSTDDISYTNISSLNYTTIAASDALGWVQVGSSPSRITTINTVSIAPGGFLYIRWSSADAGGSGSRDEIGLDDISIVADALPTTQLSTGFCAYTSTSTSEFIWADSLGTPTTQNNYRYKFKLINGASTLTWTTNNEWPIMQFYLIPGYLPATTYTTSVAWSSDFGATFSVYGPTCTLTSPGAPSTQLSAGSCGSSPGSYSQILYANQVAGANQYEYQLINSSLSYTQSYVKTNNNFNLTQFTGLTNGTTYSVTVRANVNSVWSPYGTSCNVTTPSSLPTTSLSASNCGITASAYTQLLFAVQVTGATQYEYQLINSSLSYTQSFVKTNNNFNLAQFTGLTNGSTYSVSVRVSLGTGFGNYGPVCTIMTPAITPTTSLSVSNCGITASSWSQILYANQVAGANQYEYQLINSSLSYTQSFVKTNNNFNLTQFSGLANGTTYSVSVRVNLGTGFGNYGSACNITTPSTLPTTALQPSYCSYTAPTFSTIIFATAVSGATQYEYRLINSSLSYTQSFVKTNGNFNLSLFTGLALSTTYTAQVRVFFNSAWGPYGSVCNVTTPASASPLTVNVIPYLRLVNTVEDESIETFFDAMVYPNPYTQQFAVNLSRYKVNESVCIRVFDATGKLIEQHSLTPNEVSNLNLGAQYPAGIYNIVVSQAGKAKSIKVVKP